VVLDLELGGQTPSVSVGRDYTALYLTLPPDALKVTVNTLASIVRDPAFEAAEVRKAQLAHMRELYDRSFTVEGFTEELTMTELYGEDHPWAVDAKTEGEAVGALTRDDLIAYHSNVYRPSASAILVAGAVKQAQVEVLVREAFEDWPEPSEAVTQRPPEFKTRKRSGRHQVRAVLIGGDESHIWVKQPAAPYAHPDMHALRLLAYVLGGGYTSRAQLRLRHDGGITYGVDAGVDAYDDAGVFWITTSTHNSRLGEAADGLVEEIGRLRETPISEDELRSAKAHYRASLEFADNRGELGYLAKAFATGQGADAVQRALEDLEAVTADDVQRVARAYLSDALNFFILTDFLKTKRRLKRLGRVDFYVRERP
jgi:zinc protease